MVRMTQSGTRGCTGGLHVFVVTITPTYPVRDPEVHRTNPRSSPSPSGPSVCLEDREPVVHTTTITINTDQSGVLGSVVCTHDHHRHYPTPSGQGSEVHDTRPPKTTVTTTVRVRVRRSSVHVYDHHNLTRTISGPRTYYIHPWSSDPLRTGVLRSFTLTDGLHHPFCLVKGPGAKYTRP